MRALLAALVLVGFTSPAFAQAGAGGTITLLRTGWNADSFGIVLQGPIVNPANCPTPDGYISVSSDPGYNTYYAAALTAYVVKQPVLVTIHNTQCGFAGRPKIIGINLGN